MSRFQLFVYCCLCEDRNMHTYLQHIATCVALCGLVATVEWLYTHVSGNIITAGVSYLTSYDRSGNLLWCAHATDR